MYQGLKYTTMMNFRKIHPLALLLLAALGLIFAAPQSHADDDAGLFWSFSGPAGQKGYLLGTIHSEDPRVLGFTPEFLEALSGSDIFAMELVPDMNTLARLADYMHLPGDQSLAGIIGQERFEAVALALQSYGVPAEQVARMKPWAAMMTLSVPPPETGLFMDFSLSLRAAGNGLKVIGLETLEQQLAFLEDMPEQQELLLLDHAVDEFSYVAAVHEQMVATYLIGSLDKLYEFSMQQMESLDSEAQAYFFDEGIDARNHRMLEVLMPSLAQGKVFVAVGALHLPGVEGLISLLQQQGFRLEAMPNPFPEQGQETEVIH